MSDDNSNERDSDLAAAVGMLGGNTDTRAERVIMSRIGGQSIDSIAKRERCTIAEVHRIITRWADAVICGDVRKGYLALELARLDLPQATFLRQAFRET